VISVEAVSGVEGAFLVLWVGGPHDAFFGFYQGEAFQSQTNTEKILYKSLGTAVLQELKNSNYIRYLIEVINTLCGGWLVSTLL